MQSVIHSSSSDVRAQSLLKAPPGEIAKDGTLSVGESVFVKTDLSTAAFLCVSIETAWLVVFSNEIVSILTHNNDELLKA